MRITPPDIRRPLGSRLAVVEEARALAIRSGELLGRIDELCAKPARPDGLGLQAACPAGGSTGTSARPAGWARR